MDNNIEADKILLDKKITGIKKVPADSFDPVDKFVFAYSL